MKQVKITIRITELQNERLTKISKLSLKSKADLIREGINLLFKTPGGKIDE